MTILLISLHADPTVPAGILEGGGTHSYVRELMTILAAKQIRTILLTRKSAPELADCEIISEYGSIQRITIGGENAIDKKALFFMHDEILAKAVEIIQSLTELPNVIHSIYWNSGQLAAELSEMLGIPFVHTVISNGLRRSLSGAKETLEARYAAELQVFQKASYVLCITESERRDLEILYHIRREKLVVLGRPVPTAFSNPAHDTFGEPVRYLQNGTDNNYRLHLESHVHDGKAEWWLQKAFLYYGRMAQSKGVDIIARAWARLYECYGDSCPPLWLVGGSPSEISLMRSRILSHVKNLEYFEYIQKIIWWGYLDQRGISALLLKSLAVLMHSMYEPGGRVIIEALSEGIPVIATPVGFGGDYIKDWFNGFLVDYNDIDDLFHKMNHFVRQPYLANSMGLNARCFSKKIIEQWDFSVTHTDVYNAAVDQSPYKKTERPRELYGDEYAYKRIHIYPYSSEILSDTAFRRVITRLLKSETEEISRQNSKEQTSVQWRIVSEHREFSAKQFYTRFNLRALYDCLSKNLVTEARHIYATEKKSRIMRGIAPIIASDDERLVIVRRAYPLAASVVSNMADLAKLALTPLRAGAKHSEDIAELCGSLQYFERSWFSCNSEELLAGYYEYIQLFSQTDWSLDAAFSLPFHIKRLNWSLSQCRYVLQNAENSFITALLRAAESRFHSSAAPQYAACIGNPYVINLGYDDSCCQVIFLDGERIHIGETHRDLAVFLCSLFDTFHCYDSTVKWSSLTWLFSPDCGERNRLICWLMSVTAEELFKYSVVQNWDRVRALSSRASALLNLAD